MSTRSVVWITLESVRYDHTSVGDASRATTPALARLAEDGTSFDRAYTHDVWTRASTASMLTGLASSAHRTWTNESKLPPSITTIPEAFQSAGYRTIAVSQSLNTGPDTGLDRGFDTFDLFAGLDVKELLRLAGPTTVAKWLAQLRRHSSGVTRDTIRHCLGYFIEQAAVGHVQNAAAADEPVFLYVHYGDSHHPYVPPVTERGRFLDENDLGATEAVELAVQMSKRLHEHIATDDPFTPSEWEALTAMYDACLHYVDRLVDSLVQSVRELLPDPIVVVTADHGELFDERGLLAHMLTTTAAVSRVPLVVSGLSGISDTELVQPADVMRTICAELGVDHPVPIGVDLRSTDRTTAVTQRGGERARKKLDIITDHDSSFPAEQFPSEDLTTLRTPEWCYHDAGEPTLTTHDDETTDVSDAHPAVVERLAEECGEWLDTHGQPVGETQRAEFDRAAAEHLRKMGYL